MSCFELGEDLVCDYSEFAILADGEPILLQKHEQLKRVHGENRSGLPESIRRQWPCERLSLAPSTSTAAYFNMTRVQDAAQKLFSCWNNNIHFRQYLSEIANHARVETVPLDNIAERLTGDHKAIISIAATEKEEALLLLQ